ncbi:hypothetical protein [Pseudophaeobacter sp.]|jgi:hypothetical protein|uniref:hypothetical protein n=1 Tax=Pseudophaeobacter sp. TaxID=1971739 RepID=UPI0032D93954
MRRFLIIALLVVMSALSIFALTGISIAAYSTWAAAKYRPTRSVEAYCKRHSTEAYVLSHAYQDGMLDRYVARERQRYGEDADLLDGLAHTVIGAPVGRGSDEQVRFAREFADMHELLCYDLAEKHRLDLVWGLKHPVE